MNAQTAGDRDRDPAGRARNARVRDELGRPLGRAAGGHAPTDQAALPPSAALARAQELLDAGRPFDAHEVFEAVWKDTEGPTRALWRGLAQIAVGCTHALRGNESGARALFDRGRQTLAEFASENPDGVDVDGIRAWAEAACDDLSLVSRPPRLVADVEPMSGSEGASLRPLSE
jgi:uncharacterized protein